MKVLAVTGLTGKSGTGEALLEIMSENAKQLSEVFPDGVRLIVRSISSINDEMIKKYNGQITVADLTDEESLADAFKDADTILHVAGVHWSRQVVSAAAKCGVKRIITVHTTGIYSKYKQAGEQYRKTDAFVNDICKNNNIKLTMLRPTMIYGKTTDKNISIFIKMVDKFPIMPVVNGAKYELQPVHCLDVAKGCYQVLMSEANTAGKEFVLSGKEAIALKDMLTIIGTNLGKKVRFISCPYEIAYLGACFIYLITIKKIDLREKVQRLCEVRAFSHDEATNAFNFQPMSFEEGIIQEVKDYLEGK